MVVQQNHNHSMSLRNIEPYLQGVGSAYLLHCYALRVLISALKTVALDPAPDAVGVLWGLGDAGLIWDVRRGTFPHHCGGDAQRAKSDLTWQRNKNRAHFTFFTIYTP